MNVIIKKFNTYYDPIPLTIHDSSFHTPGREQCIIELEICDTSAIPKSFGDYDNLKIALCVEMMKDLGADHDLLKEIFPEYFI